MKKQKPYPDECPVFEVVGEFEPRRGEHIQLESWDTPPRSNWWPLHAWCGGVLVDYFEFEQVRPLTPAAEDLLAAIREELGS